MSDYLTWQENLRHAIVLWEIAHPLAWILPLLLALSLVVLFCAYAYHRGRR